MYKILAICALTLFVSKETSAHNETPEDDERSPQRRYTLTDDAQREMLSPFMTPVSLLAAALDGRMFYTLGFAASIEDPLKTGVFAFNMITRVPVHMSRLCSMGVENKKLTSQNPYWYIVAKYAHATLNHAFPLTYMNVHMSQKKRNIIVSSAGTTISYFSKGLEDEECLFKRMARGEKLFPDGAESAFSNTLLSIAACSKGALIQHLFNMNLMGYGVERDTRVWVSYGAGCLSAALTIGFESDKFLQYGKKMLSFPDGLVLSTLQAAGIMSMYAGLNADPFAYPLMTLGSIYSLETVTEALSIDYNSTTFMPALRRVDSSCRRWFGF